MTVRAPAGEEVRWLLTPDVHSVARAAVPTVVEDAGERQPAAEVGGVDELLHQQVAVASGREPQPLDRREVQARNVHAACGATVHGAYGTGARTAYVQSSPPGASQPCASACSTEAQVGTCQHSTLPPHSSRYMPATRGVQRFTLGGLTASCIAAEQLRPVPARSAVPRREGQRE